MAFQLRIPPTKYRLVRGHVLRLRGGIIGVPIEYQGDGWWHVLVVGGDNPSYPVGGYDITVPVEDIDEAERIDVV